MLQAEWVLMAAGGRERGGVRCLRHEQVSQRTSKPTSTGRGSAPELSWKLGTDLLCDRLGDWIRRLGDIRGVLGPAAFKASSARPCTGLTASAHSAMLVVACM